jgi:stearoyl-CoA desaturase (delta-9 desaturase)
MTNTKQEQYKILLGVILCQIAFVYMLFFGTGIEWLISFVIYFLMFGLGISLYNHRMLSHRSVINDNIFLKHFLLFCSTVVLQGSTLAWVGMHREHHAYSDTSKDPHSPNYLGFVKTYFHIWNKITIPSALVSDIIKNKTAKFIHTNYLKILIAYIIILYTIDPLIGIIVYSIPALLMFHATGITNSLGHGFGYKNSDTGDSSTNSKIIALFTAGEGLHNNHHADPKSAISSRNEYEVDLSQYFIKMIRK